MMSPFFSNLISDFRLCFRSKSLTFINIFGLAIGLSICMFLLTYISFEFSYDKQYRDSERIYRILTIWEEQGKKECLPIGLRKLRGSLFREVPEVENVIQLYRDGRVFSKGENTEKFRSHGCLVDSTFFDVFDFKSVYGDLTQAFSRPRQCVLTLSLATKLFGKQVDPTGQLLEDGEQEPCQVVAVIEDLPQNSHFDFEYLESMTPLVTGYDGLEFYTYFKLRDGIQVEQALEKCNRVNEKLLKSYNNLQLKTGSCTESLRHIHLSTFADFDFKISGGMSGVLFMMCIGLLILLIAISNFIALFMIQGEKRSVEISVRKTNGACRADVMVLLFKETCGITFIAFLLAILFYSFFYRIYMELLSVYVPSIFEFKEIWFYFLLLYLFTSFIAGIYPALNLSRFQPLELIRNSNRRKYRLTTASVVIQVSVVLFCISALWIVIKQLKYTMKLPFGYEIENVMYYSLDIQENQARMMKEELAQYPEIIAMGVSQGGPIHENSGGGFRIADRDESEEISGDEERVGLGYFETLGIPLVEGRLFTGQINTDALDIVLSENMVKALQLRDPIGKKVRMGMREFTVIGVVKDTRYGSSRMEIGNKVYTSYWNKFWRLYVRFQEGQYEKATQLVEKTLNKYGLGLPIKKYLVKDEIAEEYKNEQRIVRILTLGGILAVLLAFMGLFALYSFVARQKSHEMAIRRIAGASISHIVILMIRRMLVMILPAVPLGLIISYQVMSRWLEGFVYVIPIPVGVFVWTAVGVLLWISILVWVSSWRIIVRNPVQALKTGE